MLDLAHEAVEAARKAGADYADARFVTEESESLSVEPGDGRIDRSLSQGVGIRARARVLGVRRHARTSPRIWSAASLAVGIARRCLPAHGTGLSSPRSSR